MTSVVRFLHSEQLKSFFMGKRYPILLAFLVVISSVFGIELYIAALHLLLTMTSIFVTGSMKPLLFTLMTFVMHLSVKHAPFYPTYSEYFYDGAPFYVFLFLCIATFIFLLCFVIKNKIYKKVRFGKTPMLLPMIVFSAALLINGAFSEGYEIGNLIFGFANAVCYSVVFLIIYYGLENESSDSLAEYFSYLSTLISFVIIAELTVLFITSDVVFVDGSISNIGVALGWGIRNLVGVSLAVLIPSIFYGVHSSKYPWYYFAVATLTLVFAALTVSRNALLFSILSYGVCVIVSCFVGKHKRSFRYVVGFGALLLVIVVLIFYKQLSVIFADYLERGFSDNGRYALWREAFSGFLDSPVLGNGFYGFDVDDSLLYGFGPLAKQAHNTLLQLLSATGIVGFLAYGYYRAESLRPVFKRPSMKKTLLAGSIAVFLLASLLDNFVFNIYPTFYYTVALVIIHKASREESNS